MPTTTTGSAAHGGSVEARNIAGRDIIQELRQEDPAQAKAFEYIFQELHEVHGMAQQVATNSHAIVQMQAVIEADHERILGNGRVGLAETVRDNSQQIQQLRQDFQDHIHTETKREHRRDIRTAIGVALSIVSPPVTILLLAALGVFA
jgi:hypothetical protein